MNCNLKILKQSELFKNFSEEQIASLLLVGNSFTKTFKKSEIILNEGNSTDYIYFIIEGEVTIYQNDIDGNTFLKDKMLSGASFGHIFALTKKQSNCLVISSTNTIILYIKLDEVLVSDSNEASIFKNNILMFLAKMTYKTSNHLSTLSLKTLRKKLFSYLMNFNYQSGTFFKVPLNREEMAQYLGVNRSSLSKELIALKSENILDYKKNEFKIIDIDYFESHI